MGEKFLEPMVERINKTSYQNLRVAKHDDQVRPGNAYFAPSGSHLEFKGIGKFIKIELTDLSPRTS